MTTTTAKAAHFDGPNGNHRSSALELSGVFAGYGRSTVLRNVSLEVPAGSVTALIGPNGAGKTTLLKTASGLIRPTAGRVRMAGVDVTGRPPFQRTALGLCHIPEGRGIFRSLTVRENLAMQATKGAEKDAVERAAEVFPILSERQDQVAGTMSGGQQQMLALARAYVRRPQLILVDEPSLGLAPTIVDEIFAYLEGLAAAGVALLVVDQFVTRVLDMADRAYVLRQGEVAIAGTPAEIRQHDVFEQYMGG